MVRPDSNHSLSKTTSVQPRFHWLALSMSVHDLSLYDTSVLCGAEDLPDIYARDRIAVQAHGLLREALLALVL